MSYDAIEADLEAGRLVVIDGGTGTELERRGVAMVPGAWCGPVTLGNAETLERIHVDYIRAGARVITANTYASSRLMLAPSGYGDKVEQINRLAVETALRARDRAGVAGVAVAGSMSHSIPVQIDTDLFNPDLLPSAEVQMAAHREMAGILKDGGVDLIMLEMMYVPDRMSAVVDAALETGLPVWAGMSARRGEDGSVLCFTRFEDIPFDRVAEIANRPGIVAAGAMHTPSDLIADATEIVRRHFDGPLFAYPDSGYFKAPRWQFQNAIAPDAFAAFARQWRDAGMAAIGGCCGLSPEHIRRIAALRPGGAI